MSSRVAIARVADITDSESILAAVKQAIELASDFALLVRGKSVVLKPNVFCPMPPPVTTDPRVISALISFCREAGAAKVTVAEGRSVSTARYRKSANTTRACFEATGMAEAAALADEVVYLEEDEFVTVDVPDGQVLQQLSVPKTIAQAEVLINIPVLKNHSLALVTLGIKNLHGVVSDADKLFGHDYNRIPMKLVDILRAIRPALTVIDGVRGLEGDHADMGKPVDFRAMFASADTVACDAVACTAIGLDPFEVDTTRIAHERGVGVGELSQIEVVGEIIQSVRRPFARPDIEISEERFPGLRVIAGDYCRSCEYYIRRGIDRLAEQKLLDPADPITLILGKNPKVPEAVEGRVVIAGHCAFESGSVAALKNELLRQGCLRAVDACPPMEFRMRAVEMTSRDER